MLNLSVKKKVIFSLLCFYISLKKRVTFAKLVSKKKGYFRFIVFLNFIVRKRVTYAKFVSEKKGDFWFIMFLNFIEEKGDIC